MNRLSETRLFLKGRLAALDTGCEWSVSTGASTFSETEPDTVSFSVIALAGERSNEVAERLDEMLDSQGPLSVKSALEEDRTCGDRAVDLRVAKTSGVRTFPGEVIQLGAEWQVNVLLP